MVYLYHYSICSYHRIFQNAIFNTGLVVYLCYGIHFSKERHRDDEEVILYDVSDAEHILQDSETR